MNYLELAFEDWKTNGGIYIIFTDSIHKAREKFNYIKALVESSSFFEDYRIDLSRLMVSNLENQFQFIKPSDESILKIRGLRSFRIVFHILEIEGKYLKMIMDEHFQCKYFCRSCKLIIE